MPTARGSMRAISRHRIYAEFMIDGHEYTFTGSVSPGTELLWSASYADMTYDTVHGFAPGSQSGSGLITSDSVRFMLGGVIIDGMLDSDYEFDMGYYSSVHVSGKWTTDAESEDTGS